MRSTLIRANPLRPSAPAPATVFPPANPWSPTAAPALLLKRLLSLFWAGYFSMIALTNLVDLLDALGAINWTFLNSGTSATCARS